MTKEEKVLKRKLRAKKRFEKRKSQWERIKSIAYYYGVPFSAARSYVRHGYFTSWRNPNSPTGYSQKCSWFGICQSPCNGDC